jgi:hypothetical protein
MKNSHLQPQWNDYTLSVNRLPGKAHCEPNWSWQPAPIAVAPALDQRME